jgi:hypothetical protein
MVAPPDATEDRMAQDPRSPDDAGARTPPPADEPDRSDRGWRTLARSREETVAFAGTLGGIAAVVLATVLWGLPGLLVASLLLTLAIMAVLIVISMGN